MIIQKLPSSIILTHLSEAALEELTLFSLDPTLEPKSAFLLMEFNVL